MKRVALAAILGAAACKMPPPCSQHQTGALAASEAAGKWRILSLHSSYPKDVRVADSVRSYAPIALITTGTITGFDFKDGMNEYAVSSLVGTTSMLSVGTVNPATRRVVRSSNRLLGCPEFLQNGDLLFTESGDAAVWHASTNAVSALSLRGGVVGVTFILDRPTCPQAATNGSIAWRDKNGSIHVADMANMSNETTFGQSEYEWLPFFFARSGAFVVYEEESLKTYVQPTAKGSRARKLPRFSDIGVLSPDDRWMIDTISSQTSSGTIHDLASGCQSFVQHVVGDAYRWEIGP